MAAEPNHSRKSLEEQSRLLALSHDAIIGMTAGRRITSWNAGAEEIYGYTAEEARGRIIHELLRTIGPVTTEQMDEVLAREGRWDGELAQTRRDGARLVVESRQVRVEGPGAELAILEINRDISERRRSEEAVLEAQKLESLGLLTGGIAHRFNNLLTGILGNASLALELQPDSPAAAMIREVLRSAGEAALLTRQLLAYSGKNMMPEDRIDPRELVREVLTLARESIPTRVELKLDLAEDTPLIRADRSQAGQLVMNLILNAAEAIPKSGGAIAISTGGREFHPGHLPRATRGTPAPGRYMRLAVQDDGCGMDEATQAQMFDPFFTTKFIGRGLGLAAVLGIVRRHGGFLAVESKPKIGSTFEVFLPAA